MKKIKKTKIKIASKPMLYAVLFKSFKMKQLKEILKYINEEGANAYARSKQYKHIEQIKYFQGGKAFAYFDIARRMKKLLK